MLALGRVLLSGPPAPARRALAGRPALDDLLPAELWAQRFVRPIATVAVSALSSAALTIGSLTVGEDPASAVRPVTNQTISSMVGVSTAEASSAGPPAARSWSVDGPVSARRAPATPPGADRVPTHLASVLSPREPVTASGPRRSPAQGRIHQRVQS